MSSEPKGNKRTQDITIMTKTFKPIKTRRPRPGSVTVVAKCKLRCKAVQLWREHSLLQNLYQGLRFNKVLAMAKD